MKSSVLAAILAVSLASSSVLGAVHPNPTAAIHHHKRQQFPDGVDVSSLLANPSEYLSAVSTAIAKGGNAQYYAQQWSSLKEDQKFQVSLSSALVDRFGTKTAASAFAQFTSACNTPDDDEDDDDEDGDDEADDTTADASPAANAGVVNADVSSGSSQQLSNQVVSGASGLSASSAVTLAIAALPAVLVAVL